ncbi:hypothetical protein AAFN75_17425 [Algibacter sp. AS12]|uniref:hypothetical protein n=1 Tax=Algibacter sp. AS12 TaxID=3135773 RepID=UPI00398B6F5E
MSLRRIAKINYLRFSAFEGSQHIASEFAIYKLLEVTKKFKRVSILEVGLGIGSISDTILTYKKSEDLYYVGTENNAFCLESLKKNLNEKSYNTLRILSGIDKVFELRKKFDLAIIDGSDDNILSLANQLESDAIIAIEGDRITQVNDLKKVFPKAKFVHSISLRKNDPNGVGIPWHWQGGIKLLFLNPTNSQLVYCFTEKLKTKLINMYRKFLK